MISDKNSKIMKNNSNNLNPKLDLRTLSKLQKSSHKNTRTISINITSSIKCTKSMKRQTKNSLI